MNRKNALGRGLSALIPIAATTAPDAQGLLQIEIDRLEPNRRQPRRLFDDDGLAELAESIKATGILQPVLLTRDGDRLRILAGERRVRAARLAGLTRVPAIIRERLEDRDHLLLALVENLQRRDLTALEEAEAFRSLRDEFGMTQDQVADKVGKDRATVANTIRLLKLPAAVRESLERGLLSAGHARALLALTSAEDQESLASEAIKGGLSVRAVEARVNELLEKAGKKKSKTAKGVDADTRDAELRLQRALGTKVEIKRKKRGGELRIAFYSEEELIGLFERLIKDSE
ncbi:MAG: ParB/RepB/Spo0J family partition protein [Thermoanaerobaculia bacterium]